MAQEPIDVIVRQRGAVTTGRQIAGIGTAASTTNKALRLMQGTLLTLGVGIGLAQSIRVIADFSQEMSTVRAITGATTDQFKELRQEAKLLGATTRFSASEASEAMTFLARAGFNVEEVMGAVGGTLDLAQAGALGLGEAADIASNVLTGFRLEVDQTARVVDVLALAANSGNTTVGQLGQAMKFVAPVAAGLGVSLEETAAAATALSDAGLQASLAGTGLRKILSELESPAAKTVRLLQDMGLSSDAVKVSTVGLTTALEVLKDAGVDTGLALELFGDRGGPAFEVLSSSIPKVKELTEALRNADGTARRIATTMDQNLNGALLAARSAAEALVLAFGDLGAESFLTEFFRGLADVLRSVAGNMDVVLDVAKATAIALAVLFAPKIIIGFGALALAILKVAASVFTLDVALGLITIPLGIILGLFTVMTAAGGVLFVFRDQIKLSAEGVATLGDFLDVLKTKVVNAFRVIKEENQGFFIVANALIDEFTDGFGLSTRGIILFIAKMVDFASVGLKVMSSLFTDFLKGLDISARALVAIFSDPAAIPGLTEEAIKLFTELGLRSAGAFVAGMLKVGVGGAEKFVNDIFDEAEQTARERMKVQARAALALPGFFGAGKLDSESVRILKEEMKALAGARGEDAAAAANQANVSATVTASFNQLLSALNPVIGAEKQLAAAEDTLSKAYEAGIIPLEFATALLTRQKTLLADQLDPLKALNVAIDEQFRLLGFSNEERQVEIALSQFLLDLLGQRNPLLEEEVELLRQRLIALGEGNAQKAVEEQIVARFVTSQEQANRVIAEAIRLAEANIIAQSQATRVILEAEAAAGKAAGTFGGQFKASVAELKLSFMDFGAEVGDVLKNTFKGAEDALVSFVKTGKLDFRSMVDSMIDDLIRLAIRQAVLGPLSKLLPFGKGGTVAAQPFATGGLIDTPVLFQTNRGPGIAGERGREAILPTVRNSGLATVPATTGTDVTEIPLRRLAGGVLGVDLSNLFRGAEQFAIGGLTSGGSFSAGSKTTTGNITYAPSIEVNVNGNGVGGENSLEQGRNISKEVGKQAKRAFDELLVEFVNEQNLPGGMLNDTGRNF